DTGRQGHMLDWGFLTDPAKAEDHIHRAMHVTAVATQAITRTYYDSDTLYRYMSGCSGGGRMATESITRHPEDFDGVLLGAPGGRSNMTMAAFVYNAQQMNREPGAWLSPAKLAMLDKKVTAACDELDGAKDGEAGAWPSPGKARLVGKEVPGACDGPGGGEGHLLPRHRQGPFDFGPLKCPGGDGPECLTEPELKSVKAVAAGPIDPDGKPLKPGYPLSNISGWSGFLGAVPPPLSDEASAENMARSSAGYVIGSSMAKVLFGPGFNALEDFDFKNPEHIAKWRARSREIGFGTPYSADLRGLQKAGGKVLMWNGVSDPCCIDTELEEYYLEAGEMVGGMDKLTEFATFYRVPGMAHCGGGTGPQDATDQFLNAMIDWVENGKKPGPIVAHRGADRAKLLFADPATGQVSGVMVPPPAGESRDFLLCPHPQVARFDASKASDPQAVYNAANWSCRMPG